MSKWIITDNSVIGGNKHVTPFGEIIFLTEHETEDERVANYFKDKVDYSVFEVEPEVEPEESEDAEDAEDKDGE